MSDTPPGMARLHRTRPDDPSTATTPSRSADVWAVAPTMSGRPSPFTSATRICWKCAWNRSAHTVARPVGTNGVTARSPSGPARTISVRPSFWAMVAASTWGPAERCTHRMDSGPWHDSGRSEIRKGAFGAGDVRNRTTAPAAPTAHAAEIEGAETARRSTLVPDTSRVHVAPPSELRATMPCAPAASACDPATASPLTARPRPARTLHERPPSCVRYTNPSDDPITASAGFSIRTLWNESAVVGSSPSPTSIGSHVMPPSDVRYADP